MTEDRDAVEHPHVVGKDGHCTLCGTHLQTAQGLHACLVCGATS